MRAKDFIEKHIDAILQRGMKSSCQNIIEMMRKKSKGHVGMWSYMVFIFINSEISWVFGVSVA
tara:strand:+ start:2517 stop:2705 length:189 start_codon:yes stop_codon:yes gene_type:complete